VAPHSLYKHARNDPDTADNIRADNYRSWQQLERGMPRKAPPCAVQSGISAYRGFALPHSAFRSLRQ
jgi:hypothetical protein